MNKRLIIIVIIVISLFALIFIGAYSYNKYEKQNQPEEENNEIYDQDDYVTESEETIEDIIDRIKEYYADNENTTVVYNETKSGCWYFSDSENNRYKYCIYNGEIEVIK